MLFWTEESERVTEGKENPGAMAVYRPRDDRQTADQADQVIRETRRAGAPRHRQRFLSVRPGGWSRTPVHSSGTRLTLALAGRGGLDS
jgi:hypothetical protein